MLPVIFIYLLFAFSFASGRLETPVVTALPGVFLHARVVAAA